MVALPLAKVSRPDLLPLQVDAPEPSVVVIGIGDVDQLLLIVGVLAAYEFLACSL